MRHNSMDFGAEISDFLWVKWIIFFDGGIGGCVG